MKNTPTHRRPKLSALSSTGSTNSPTTRPRRRRASASNRPRSAWLRSIACISTSRADAGIYGPLLERLSDEPRWETSMLLGGTHHRALFGESASLIRKLPRCRLEKIDHFVSGDRPAQVAATAAKAVDAFSRHFDRRRPDLLFVLGDRTEMLAAALAATIHRIPLAHLHGGDITAGAYDDVCRHAITKLAHLHFPAHPVHAKRIARLGEESWRIHAVGALALDGIRKVNPLSQAVTKQDWVLTLKPPLAVVSFHPETLSPISAEHQIAEVLSAVDSFNGNMILIGPNADVGHESIRGQMQTFVLRRRGNAAFTASLSQPDFWTCLARATLLIGNSSAGILEAASFRLPVVNIGDRQRGRIQAANIIDAPLDRKRIAAAIHRALSTSFRNKLTGLKNPYGDGRAAERICRVLSGLPGPAKLLQKQPF